MHYRPVSNLGLVKVLEWVLSHLAQMNMTDIWHSACRMWHSAKTAVLPISTWLSWWQWTKAKLLPLALLDLSASFHAVEPTILLGRLHSGSQSLSWCGGGSLLTCPTGLNKLNWMTPVFPEFSYLFKFHKVQFWLCIVFTVTPPPPASSYRATLSHIT